MADVTGGVVLCSGRRADAKQGAVDRLKAEFFQFKADTVASGPVVSTYPVIKTGDYVDGGNSGGGDGPETLKFVAGRDLVGLWNFRHLGIPHEKEPDGTYNINVFPEAGRIELCLHVDDITLAAIRLAEQSEKRLGLRYLSEIFNFVLLVPYSVSKRGESAIQFVSSQEFGLHTEKISLLR